MADIKSAKIARARVAALPNVADEWGWDVMVEDRTFTTGYADTRDHAISAARAARKRVQDIIDAGGISMKTLED